MTRADDRVFRRFAEIAGKEQILLSEPMSAHTTFRIGGPADFFVLPRTGEEVRDLLSACREEEIPYYILGNGSNLLVSDLGFRGAIIQIDRNLQEISAEGTVLTAQAGALYAAVSARARQEGLTGLEFAGGIPGTVGGAVAMNAGAYGGETKDVLVKITAIGPDLAIVDLPADELDLGYRTSRIQKEGYVVLEAEMRLAEGDPEEIGARMEELRQARAEKQPLNYPSAGSTFKRPPGHFAGKLIMDAGLAGFSVGGASVSEKHCGFVINRGSATAADVYRLIVRVRGAVLQRFGVELEPEVRFLGDFSYVG